MSLIILSQPTNPHPVYNSATYVVLSDLASQYMFKYKFETYVNDVLINTTSLFPREDGTAIFDASKILKNYIADNFNPLLTASAFNFTDETIKFYVVITEVVASDIAIGFSDNTMTGNPSGTGIGFFIDSEYSYLFSIGDTIRIQQDIPYTNTGYNTTTTITGIVTNENTTAIYTEIPVGLPTYPEPGDIYISAVNYTPDSKTSTTVNGLQLSADWEEGKNLSTFINMFLPNNPTSSIFGTRTNSLTMKSSDKRVLSFNAHNFNNKHINKIKLVTGTGRTFVKDLSYTLDYTTAQILHFPIGLAELNAITWTSGTGLITEADLGFIVSFLYNTTELYHSIYIRIIDCGKYENYSVCYKSTRGSFWYVTMNMKNTKSIDIVSTNYQHHLEYNYGDLSREYKTNNLYAKGKIVLRTDWMNSDSEIAEVVDMLKSPVIYILKDNIIIPASVSPGTYEVKSKSQNGLVYYEITFNEIFDKNITI